MPDALLFRPGAGSGAPYFKVVACEWVDWYRKRGWFLLGDSIDVMTEDIRAFEIGLLREADETRWNRLFRRRE